MKNAAIIRYHSARTWAMATWITLWLSMAQASGDGLDCEYAVSTKDLIVCAQQEYHFEINRLNEAYRRLNELRPNSAAALKDAQQAYIKARNLTCKWQGYIFAADGTAQPLAELGCLTQQERARADHLEDILRYLSRL
jgi:uncharacterized protein YecT (DUF1311 family)